MLFAKAGTNMDKPKELKLKKTPGQEKRDVKKARFLRVFRNNGGKQYLACEVTGIHVNTVWEWRRDDEDFEQKYNNALEASTDELEKEMERRAKKKSDLLMIFSLKGRRPGKYRDNVKVEHAGSVSLTDLVVDDPDQKTKQKGKGS